MEEKTIVKSGKTSINKAIVFIIILTFIIGVACFLSMSFPPKEYNSYLEHSYYGEHVYECLNAEGRELYSSNDGDILFWEMDDDYLTNCEWRNDFWSSLCLYFNRWFPIVYITCSIIILICVLIHLTRYKFYITETNIYGKNRYKKFNVAFSDIIEITQKDKGIVIKTADKKIKLSSLKKCEEIYNYIKPNITEKQTISQDKNTIDNLKNILD